VSGGGRTVSDGAAHAVCVSVVPAGRGQGGGGPHPAQQPPQPPQQPRQQQPQRRGRLGPQAAHRHGPRLAARHARGPRRGGPAASGATPRSVQLVFFLDIMQVLDFGERHEK